jgi:hypothetical protein
MDRYICSCRVTGLKNHEALRGQGPRKYRALFLLEGSLLRGKASHLS